ncbi:MAG: Alpha/beta hydrolase family protein [Chloroflexi bacterium ADurb.Bin180]|nr:MAG: Alpha/beta hydrolase family protein [Chloroflexi bacterium ADurb.Bin180]
MSQMPLAPWSEPFFIDSQFALYGCLSRALTSTRRTAVLLCYPWGDEYQRFHRAFRQLALLLNGAGFTVLRFDWTGCGDSAGEPADWTLERWRQDALTAAAALRERTEARPLAVVGLRLGATLAALAAPALPDLRALVLWDVVADGAAYLRELRKLQRTMLARAHVLEFPPGEPTQQAHARGEESLGFPLPPRLCQELDALRFPVSPFVEQARCLWINTRSDSPPPLAGQSAAHDCFDLPSPDMWVWREAMSRTIVPRLILERIVSWLSEACP